jgi:hypothetical protein
MTGDDIPEQTEAQKQAWERLCAMKSPSQLAKPFDWIRQILKTRHNWVYPVTLIFHNAEALRIAQALADNKYAEVPLTNQVADMHPPITWVAIDNAGHCIDGRIGPIEAMYPATKPIRLT